MHIYKLLSYTFAVLLMFTIVNTAQAQDEVPRVTIEELRTYDEPLEDWSDIPNHPMVDSLVQFTGIIINHPRNSGLAGYSSDDDGINRIHIFVMDTTAASQGREAMAMHMAVVGQPLADIEPMERGDVINVTGRLDFFSNINQFAPEDVELIGQVGAGQFEGMEHLLEPMEIDLADIAEDLGGGQYQGKLENYTDLGYQYVRVTDAEMIDRLQADTGRPWWYVRDGSGGVTNRYDISLRFRNDRNVQSVNEDEAGAGYKSGYNYRRVDPDGPFVPPPSGARINLNGFLYPNAHEPAGMFNADDGWNLTIVPFHDGIIWRGENQNAVRNEEGPDDLEILGFPPSFENYMVSNATPTPDEQVTVSADILPADDDITIDDVTIHYTVLEEDADEAEEFSATVPNVDGDTYEYEFSTFEKFTLVEFQLEATDSDGLTGVMPDQPDRFFVLEEEIESLAIINQTSDGQRGPSPLEGLGMLDMDITATVVADSADGFYAVHDSDQPWSGMPLNVPSDEDAAAALFELERGDRIHISRAEVASGGDNNYFANFEFENLNDPHSDYTELFPVVEPADINNPDHNGAPYEGMMVRLENIHISDPQPFAPDDDLGQWFIQNQDDEDGVELFVRRDLRVGPVEMFTNIGWNFNDDLKQGAELNSIVGLVNYAFGDETIVLRQPHDLDPVEDFSNPSRTFSLLSPEEDATVTVDGALQIEWQETFDWDGDDVYYIFQLSEEDDEDFESPLLSLDSDDDGETPQLTLEFDTVNEFLQDRGLDNGESETFNWAVWVTDGRADTVQVSTKELRSPFFEPTYRSVTLERSTETSSMAEDHITQYKLNQNYPNPFNPTTNIEYQVPEQVHVKLTVYDILGQRVATLVDEQMNPGAYVTEFNGSRLASGVYIYRLEAGSFTQTRQMMFVK